MLSKILTRTVNLKTSFPVPRLSRKMVVRYRELSVDEEQDEKMVEEVVKLPTKVWLGRKCGMYKELWICGP